MIFEEKKINLKDGRICMLRSVEIRDAENMIEYLRMVSLETSFLLRNGDEVTYTIEAEKQLLENKRNSLREIMMVAEVEGIIAGNCGIVSIGSLRRVYHRCGFAIALKKDYWNLGIGSAMMDYAFNLAKKWDMNKLNWRWLREIFGQRSYMSNLGSGKQEKISMLLNMMIIVIETNTKW